MLDLNEFMEDGIKNIAGTARRFYLGNRQGQKFILNALNSLRKGAKVRAGYEKEGTHIPPFLIASIAAECNLHCSGCYAWATGSCSDGQEKQMTAYAWRQIFQQASDLGISFILLAGGEPLLRRELIELAGEFDRIIFPVFTNGTLIDDSYLDLFDKKRHLIPVLSMEGNAHTTDARRGIGVSDQIEGAMESLEERNILFGTSITVTTQNQDAVTAPFFVEELQEKGCGLAFYVEYVPIEETTDHLTLGDSELKRLAERMEGLRRDKKNKGMILLSFPGDEKKMGGCLAAGRGFFHINAKGGAEPCPFSPYSEVNLKDRSLLEVIRSPFFERVRGIGEEGFLNHKGGCTLFQHENDVRKALK